MGFFLWDLLRFVAALGWMFFFLLQDGRLKIVINGVIYNHCKSPYTWVIGVVTLPIEVTTPFITIGSGPTLCASTDFLGSFPSTMDGFSLVNSSFCCSDIHIHRMKFK